MRRTIAKVLVRAAIFAFTSSEFRLVVVVAHVGDVDPRVRYLVDRASP
jgi:hypothetical protein